MADQGPGIPAEERQRIFEAFYQGVDQPEGHVKGSGLGLSITREYVIAHGGRIEANQAGPEGGTCIRVWLPRDVSQSGTELTGTDETAD
ncbi:MAG: ATP-binding protein [Arhodomonas sp.]|nr:ATP-binding protein [Arhodomonas sp.]